MEFKVQIIQTTPMWQFRENEIQSGLRATEVKPKLDRFLINLLIENDIQGKGIKGLSKEESINTIKKTYPNWFIGTSNALNYKLYISNPKTREILVDPNDRKKKAYPIFFANMGNGDKKTLIRFDNTTKNNIELNFFLIDNDLAHLLTSNIADFFASHSFGSRQSKGFGCFYVNKIISGDTEEPILPKSPKNAKYKFSIPKGSFPELFKHITYFHKMLRSGINEKLPVYKNNKPVFENGEQKKEENYAKSFMYFYVQGKLEDTWDKPVIRRAMELENEVYRKICKREDRPDMDKEFKNSSLAYKTNLYRDALGFSLSQRWSFYDRDKKNNENKTKEQRKADEEMVYITPEGDSPNNTTFRFASPIHYHPIPNGENYDIYIIVEEIPDELKAKKFNITHKLSTKEVLRDMQIAQKFDLNDYLSYVYENRKSIPDQMQGNILKPIVKQVFDTLEKILQ